MKGLLEFCARGRVEAQWLSYLFVRKCSTEFDRLRARMNGESGSPIASHRLTLEAHSAKLRLLLRDVPFWIGGQLRLGLVAAEQELLADAGRNPRGLQTIRLQYEAAELLLARHGALTPGRHLAECAYLRAIHSFLKREFADALSAFKELLTPALQVQLSANEYFAALEHAGAAAMAVGDKKSAFGFFSRIPDPQRSGETVAALSFLTEQFDGATNHPPVGGCERSS